MALKISGSTVLTYDGANYSNTNIAVGYLALNAVTTGTNNTAVGSQALYDNTTGVYNTVLGFNTGRGITTGSSNTIIGAQVTGLSSSLSNTVIIADGAGNQRIYVNSSGQVCIGTTSSTSAQGTVINASYDANSTIVIGKNNYAGSNNWIEFFYGGASRGYINWNGSGVSYTSTSDYRLKENVVPFVNGLQTVNQLKPVNFDWKENGQTSTGFIAHEVQSVVPEAVSGKKDDVDQEGNPLYQGIDPSKLVVYLVAAIQELTAKVAALETSNTGATGISGATGI